MENFVVSALKYRPQTFDTVVGQSHITTTLKNAIKNNQLAHAFLFCGPRGVGKTTCARILAKTINCENRTPDGEACNQCESCRAFNNGQSFNIHELDAASNNSVDDIRALTDQVRYAPQAGKYKVYIIDEVHMLSAAAFNAFLKTLEEPPPYAVFILATTEKHKIIPTILSRCQIFDFKRITIHDTVDHLKDICKKENTDADPDALHLIAQKTEGCMRDALSTLDKIVSFTNGHLTYQNTLEHLNILDYDYYFRVIEDIQNQDAGAALLLFDEILQKGFEEDHFLEGFSSFIRDLLVCKDKQAARLLEVTGNLKNRYEKTAEKTDPAFLISALNILNEASIQVRMARNKRLLVEMCLIRLAYLKQAVELISDERTGAVSKKKITEPTAKPQMLRPPFPRAALMMEVEKKEKKENDRPFQSKAKPTEYSIPLTENRIAEPAGNSPDNEKKKKEPAVKASADKNPLFNAAGKLDPSAIRKKIEKKESVKGTKELQAVPLELQPVITLFSHETDRLKKENRVQAATNLEMAQISLINDKEVLISCRNELQKTFVEEEKTHFAEILKEQFHNPGIIVTIQVDDSLKESGNGTRMLTRHEQWERMSEKYPLVKELKDKLNLDLE